jgi:hypothetical protein
VLRNGLERFVENCEPERPRLRDAPWRQSINVQCPDQDHLLAEFVDGSHEYRIRGQRGTIPYFVIAAWSAAQPEDPGARDWAPPGGGASISIRRRCDGSADEAIRFCPTDLQ